MHDCQNAIRDRRTPPSLVRASTRRQQFGSGQAPPHFEHRRRLLAKLSDNVILKER
jgi:hypothetical protein